MTTALLAGSFDPVTRGHIDLVERAAAFAGSLVIAVGVNSAKKYRFDLAKRAAMVEAACAHVAGVRVVSFDGALVDVVDREGADVIVKGIRSGADVEWEVAQAAINRDLSGTDTLLLPCRPELAHISSSIVRELLVLGLDASRYVPDAIVPLMTDNGDKQAPEPQRAR